MGMSPVKKGGHYTHKIGYQPDFDSSVFYETSLADHALPDYFSEKQFVYPDKIIPYFSEAKNDFRKEDSDEPTYLLPIPLEKEEFPSLFFDEHIVLDTYSKNSHVEEIPCDLLSEEIFSLLQSEKNTLESQINILKNSVSQLESFLGQESEKMNQDISVLESRMKDVQFHSEASTRESNYAHLSTQLLMLKQNKRQFESQIIEDIEKKRMLISEKEKELAVLDVQIKLLSLDMLSANPFSKESKNIQME